MMPRWTIIAIATSLVGCDGTSSRQCVEDVSQTRYAQVLSFIQRDNALWLSSRRALLAAKFCKMAGSTPACLTFGASSGLMSDLPSRDNPYNFMRGTVGLFYEDIARIGVYPRFPTQMLNDPNAAQVMLVVDPHPENMGTAFRQNVDTRGIVLPEDFTLEWFDFDAASYGPYTLDLRRAALGLAAYGRSVRACDNRCMGRMADGMTRTYINTLASIARGEAAPSPQPGTIIEALVKKAIRDGDALEKLVENTVAGSDFTRLKFSGRPFDGLVQPTPAEWRDIQRLANQYKAKRSTETLELLDAARRYGQGVSSLPAPRYIMLWRRSFASGAAETFMLNVRMVIDPAFMPDLPLRVNGLFQSNVERLHTVSTRLWSTAYTDRNFEALRLGPTTYKALTWSAYNKEFAHDKLQKAFDRGATVDDLVAVGRWVGYTLASAHTNGQRSDGGNSLKSLVRDIAGREQRLVDEIRTTQYYDYERLIADHLTFQCILANEGVLAGLDQIGIDQDP